MIAREVIGGMLRKHAGRKDFHITRALCTWVAVSNGKVIETNAGQALHSCPLQSILSKAGVEEYVNGKIQEFGHFTSKREIVRPGIAVPYGTSEMWMYALRKGVLDCVVTVCDGAGSLVATDPEVVQGIGARMNGLFHTSPILRIQRQLEKRGCIVFPDAKIDQCRALESAVAAGHKRIGVSVNACYGDKFAVLRRIEKKSGTQVTIAAICSTGVDLRRAKETVKYSDITWTCASKHMRDLGEAAVLQITIGIPIFVYTQRGLDLVAAYSDKSGGELIRKLNTKRQYLLSTRKSAKKIPMGNNELRLSSAELPVSGRKGPHPLR